MIMLLLTACNQANREQNNNNNGETDSVKHISNAAMTVRDYVVKNAVIAHRGTTFWAPETTEPSFRWARNIGADYIELDLQMTRDSCLIALHDNDLSRTTNIAGVFPDKVNSPTIEFTLKELRMLDAGSWFNEAFPERANDKFIGLKILTFKDVVMIAEGYRIKKENGSPAQEMLAGQWTGHYLYEKDPDDNGNRPGIYAETKKPDIESVLVRELKDIGWNVNENPKSIETFPGKVGIANTMGRFVLQSFSHESIEILDQLLPGIPKCLLLWQADMGDNIKESYIEAINFGVEHNVHFIGPSIAGEPNNYGELTAPWMAELVHSSGMFMHPYTFDTWQQFEQYNQNVEGVFTNRADMALEYYKRNTQMDAIEVLKEIGY